MAVQRDYSLLGDSSKRAVDLGLAAASWYHTDIDRKQIMALMHRRDGPALFNTLVYYALILLSAALIIALWPSWWSLPFWLIYSVLYTSAADARWHETGHRTAFKTRWMNTVVYHIASFMLLRNPVMWRRSHLRHHSDTIIVGRDPEIITMRPPDMWKLARLFVGWHFVEGFRAMIRHAIWGLNGEEMDFTPHSDQAGAQIVARIWIAIFVIVGIVALYLGSFLPILLVGVGPALLGSWHFVLTGLLQHTGMADNVLDHRLNTRTVYMNPVSRFIYLNMNYHVEHHMFPSIPYHALPKLHDLISHDLPPATNGFAEGLKEVFGALYRQLSNPEFRIQKPLPETAKPYRAELHELA